MMQLNYDRINHATGALLKLAIGGTAVGTGLNTDPKYKTLVIAHINKLTGYKFRAATNPFEAIQSMNAVVGFTGAIRVLITALKKISDDLRLLASGPRTGFNEIKLPAVQPGSSIMPGKVNPSIPEMINMVCYQVMGCDTTIVNASQAGQLELNVMMPVIAYNLIQEIQILAPGINAFTDKCIKGIEANEKACLHFAEKSPALATALSPFIGYEKAAELAKEALEKNSTIRTLALKKGIMDPKKLEEILDLKKMTEPTKLKDKRRRK
jgi:fumarate hydratase class II